LLTRKLQVELCALLFFLRSLATGEENSVKTSVKIMIVALISTALASAETPSAPFGAWKIYHAAGDRVFMLQTISTTSLAKLDVICRRGKVAAIALEPDVLVDETALSFTGVVPTARLAFTLDDESRSEKWAVVDDGHSLTPFSETSQGKLNRSWVSRIAASKKLEVRLAGIAGEMNGQPSFETEDLSLALNSIGCSY
jgi:hypothetical protein